MNNPFTIEEMTAIVIGVLAQVLGMSTDEIKGSDAIVDDLDADSLDFVEFNATLEKRLNISLGKKGVLDHANRLTGQPELFYSIKGGLTGEGVELLRSSLSQYLQLKPGMSTHDLFNKTTVSNIASFCHGLFDYLPAACPQCSQHVAAKSPTGKVVCAACSAALLPLPGDDAQARQISAYLKDKTLIAA